MQTIQLKLFISSPGDVAEERAIAKRIVERLQGEFAGRARLEPVYWEHEPLLATAGFQDQIVRPSETDVVICILWSRLGTRLPPQFTRPDGSRYESGTEFEFEDAAAAFRDHGRPELLVYRKTAEPLVSLRDRNAVVEKLRQQELLESFVRRWFHDQQEGTLIAAFHTFEAVAQFEELLEVHLRKLIARHLPVDAATPEVPPRWQQGSPFRGLEAFELEHAPIFFGRTRATGEVLDALRRQAADGRPFVLLLGMSGSGKSSLVRAGVLPLLLQPGVIEGIGWWRHAVTRPSDLLAAGNTGAPGEAWAELGVLAGLAGLLVSDAVLPELEQSVSLPELARLLQETPQAVGPLLRAALALAATALARERKLTHVPEARLVLVIDQLEELFTHPEIAHAEREAFFIALDALVRSGALWVVATLRSDFYPRCAELEQLVALKEGAGQYDLLPPNPTEIGQLIREPAHAAGLRFEEDAVTGERLEDVLRDAAVGNPQALPLLEFTLHELYLRRRGSLLTLAAYRELGGVEGALAHRAEAVFGALPPAVKAALPVVLRALITVDAEGIAAARRTPLASFATAESRALVDAFVEARLLASDLAADGTPVVGVAHEALLRHWPRLLAWIQQNQERLRLVGRLRLATRRWLEEGRSPDFLWARGKLLAEAAELAEEELEPDEAAFVRGSLRQGRRLRLVRRAAVLALVLLTAVAGVAALQANRQRLLAERASQQAQVEAERAEAERQRAEAEKQRAEAEAVTADKTREFIVGLLAFNDPSIVQGEIPTALELLDVGAERARTELADQPEVQAALFNIIGKLYIDYGRYADAKAILEEALALRRAGGEDDALLETVTNLGAAENALGNRDQAEAYYREALALATGSAGEQSIEAADAAGNLALVLANRGAFDEAETLAREALAIHRRELPADDPRLVTSLNNLASLVKDQGNLDEAEALYREAVALARENLPGTPELATAVGNLALLLQERNDPEAEALLREALAIEQDVLGALHPTTLQTRNNLASLLTAQSRFDEAETIYRELLPLLESSLGEVHPSVAAALTNLATVRYYQSDYGESRVLLERALEIYRQQAGEESAEVAVVLGNLGTLTNSMGDLDAAEGYLRQALAIQQRIYGADSLDAALTQANLGILLRDRGAYDDAEALLSSSLATYRRLLGEESGYVAWVTQQLGTLYLTAGNPERAEPLLLEALAIERALYGPNHADVLATLSSLTDLYHQTNRIDDAAVYAADALEVSRAIYGDDNLETIGASVILASLLERQEKPTEAERLAADAVARLREALPGGSSLDLAALLAFESRLLLELGRAEEAEPLLLESYAIRREALPAGAWQIANVESMLGEVYLLQGKRAEAERLLRESYRVLRATFGDDDDRTRDAARRVSLLSQEPRRAPAGE